MLEFFERMAAGFWQFVSRIWALITPFGQARHLRGLGQGLKVFLHVLAVVCILVFLWWLNVATGLNELIKAPNRTFRDFWLPILFTLMYIMSWLGWWLWKLLSPEELSGEFPDLDEAWEEAIDSLHQAGIDIIDAPLFLVLGKALGGDEALVQSAQLQLAVKLTPRSASAPLHVFGNREGIYVTCPGASLLARQAELLVSREDDSPSAGGSSGSDGTADDDMFKTLRPKGRLKEVQNILARAREEGRSPDQLTEFERGEIKLLVADEGREQSGRNLLRAPVNLLKNTTEADLLTARLQHLCRLIVRDRRPYCPINGILLLLPYAAADRDDDAVNCGGVLERELAICRSVLQVHAPTVAVICDLETAPGFREFVERFPSDQRQRRLGQRFPLAPDVDTDGFPTMLDGGVGWICSSMVPNWVYKLFRVESPGRDDVSSVVRGNVRLYHFMGELRARGKRFARTLTRALEPDKDRPALFGGCYLGGTGREPKEQAFVAGVFRRLVENQNYVTWTNEALDEEAANLRWTTIGYVGLTISTVVLVVLGYVFWWRDR